MIVPLLFDIDLLLFARLGIGEDMLLPCRAIALAKKNGWMFGITFWFEVSGNYGGIEDE